MVGQLIGNYRVLRKLGEGGMGAVYEAVHEQIGRKAAIKVLHMEFSQNDQIASRFLNEARAVNIVQHPGVVGVFEFGQMPNHTTYIVMEYLEGETLSARLRRTGGRLGADALRLARQVASALAAAHAKGIVHRDLKPDNVMLVPDLETASGERAKLLDFGIAKVTEGPEGSNMKTRTGVIMGTPTYMSPEQCRGAGGVDDRSDVYALGVMLYEMISGAPPFVAAGMGEIMAHHLFTAPRPLHEAAPETSPELSALVHRMLAKTPAERPAMAEVTAALESLGAPRANSSILTAADPNAPRLPTHTGAPSTLGQAAGQSHGGVRRRTATLAAGGALGVLLLVGGGLWLSRGAGPEGPGGGRTENVRPITDGAKPRVRWSVSTTPPGAQIVRLSDKAVLGTTPWQHESVAGTGAVALELRQEGYAPKRVSLDRGANESVRERLEPLSRPAEVAPTPTLTPTPTPTKPARVDKGGKRPAGKTSPRLRRPARELQDDELEIVK